MGIIQRQGIKNTISAYVGILLGFVSLLIIQPRFLKPEEIGLARVLFAFSSLVATFIPFGVTNMTIRFFPHFRNPGKGHHGFLGFMLIFPLIGFLISAAGLFVFHEFIIAQYRIKSPLIVDYYSYILPFSLFISFTMVLNVYLTSLFKTTVPSYLNDVYVRLAYILLIFAYYYKYLSLPQFMVAYVGIYASQLLLLIVYLTKQDSPSLKIDWHYFKQQPVKEMLGFCFLLSLNSLASLGLKTLDSILIGKFMVLSFVGIYSIVSFIPTIIETPLNALDRIISPKIAHAYAANDIKHIKEMFYKSVKYLSLIGALLFIGVNTNISYLLNLVGKDFTTGLDVVYIISAGTLITMFGGSGSSLLIYTAKPWQGALTLTVIVIITFILNMLLIPRFGINGAALSTALSALLFTSVKFYFNYKQFKFQPYDINTVKILLATAVCFLINSVLPVWNSDVENILLRTVLLSSSYLAMIYFMKVVPEFHHYLPWIKK